MPREVHAFNLDPRPAGHLDVDDRQRDGDAGPALEHLVEEAIPQVVVIGGVASEPLVFEQIVVETVQRTPGGGSTGGVQASRHVLAHLFQSPEVGSRVERRVAEAGNEQCRLSQALVGAGGGPGELLNEFWRHYSAAVFHLNDYYTASRRRRARSMSAIDATTASAAVSAEAG